MISEKFCAAKWNEFSINLQQLTIRSCHLADTIRLKLSDYRDNPLLFFNNPEFESIKKRMLNNEEPEACNYCWKIENNGQFKSERHIKTNSPYNFPDIPRIEEAISKSEMYYPSYLEIAFNNTCNLRCLYCDGVFSSSLNQLITNHKIRNLRGERDKNHLYYMHTGKDYEEIKNIFFEKTFPAIINNLRVLRLTGGEITIQPEFEQIINMSKDRNISLGINTNLSSSDTKFEKFKNKLKEINNSFKLIEIFVSVDTFGKRAEWIRDRLDYSRLQKRIISILEEIPNIRINIMCTLNVFSINKSNIRFIKFIKMIKEKYKRTYFGIETIRDPESFRIKNLPLSFKKYYYECLAYIKENKQFFLNAEINNFEKIIDEINEGTNEEKEEFLIKIVELNEDLLKIKKKDFFIIFPEYKKLKPKIKKNINLNNNIRIFK